MDRTFWLISRNFERFCQIFCWNQERRDPSRFQCREICALTQGSGSVKVMRLDKQTNDSTKRTTQDFRMPKCGFLPLVGGSKATTQNLVVISDKQTIFWTCFFTFAVAKRVVPCLATLCFAKRSRVTYRRHGHAGNPCPPRPTRDFLSPSATH